VSFPKIVALEHDIPGPLNDVQVESPFIARSKSAPQSGENPGMWYEPSELSKNRLPVMCSRQKGKDQRYSSVLLDSVSSRGLDAIGSCVRHRYCSDTSCPIGFSETY